MFVSCLFIVWRFIYGVTEADSFGSGWVFLVEKWSKFRGTEFFYPKIYLELTFFILWSNVPYFLFSSQKELSFKDVKIVRKLAYSEISLFSYLQIIQSIRTLNRMMTGSCESTLFQTKQDQKLGIEVWFNIFREQFINNVYI